MRHVIAILLQNEAGALTRVTGLISAAATTSSRCRSPHERPHCFASHAGHHRIRRRHRADQRQLLKLVDVVGVEDMTSGDHLARELLLIKLQISAEHLESAAALVRRAGGKVLASNPSSYVVELASTEFEIGEFIANMSAFGDIIEVVRSGILGMRAVIHACM